MNLLAQTRFQNVNEVDWTVNAGIYLALAIALAGVWLWRGRCFERAVDDACAGRPVSVREAYNRFWMAFALSAVVAIGLGVFCASFDVRRLFVAA